MSNIQSIQLYDYQQALVNKAREAYRNGYKAPCIVAPCGAGKSVCIAAIIHQTALKRHKTLFLVHRKELIEQIENTLKNYGVNMQYVELGMVQTVASRIKRTNRYTPSDFDLIVIDENHHVLAKSYRDIIDYFSNAKILGFTATPVRLNGDGLGDVNDILIEEVDAKWLIEHKRLAPYHYYSIPSIDRGKLKTSSTGEYTDGSVGKALGKTIFGDVVSTYQKIADGQKTILYAHNIEFSKMYADEFNTHGITAAHIDAKTPKAKRASIIQDFRDGKISILCNVDLIGEGFDVPDCTAVILARPTASLSLHIQQSMRPMRYRPDKVATIIDHVGNAFVHGLPDMERVWTLEKKEHQKKEVDPYPIWQCEDCLMVFQRDEAKEEASNIEGAAYKCPECGYIELLSASRGKEIDDTVELVKISNDDAEKTYWANRNWKKAKSFKELQHIGNARGYKPSWAAFKAKELHLHDTPAWVKKYASKPTTGLTFNF